MCGQPTGKNWSWRDGRVLSALGNLSTGWACPWGNPQATRGLPRMRRNWHRPIRKRKCNFHPEQSHASWPLDETLSSLSKVERVEGAPTRTLWRRAGQAETRRFSQAWAHTLVISALLSYTVLKKREKKPKDCSKVCWHYAIFSDSSRYNVDQRPREEGLGVVQLKRNNPSPEKGFTNVATNVFTVLTKRGARLLVSCHVNLYLHHSWNLQNQDWKLRARRN